MALSGTYDFNLTATEIVQESLKVLGVLGEGETMSAEMLNDGIRKLNLLVKFWDAQGLHLWKYQEIVIFLEVSKQSYLIGQTGDRATPNAIINSLAAAATAPTTVISVNDSTGMNIGDNVGVVLEDNTIFWDTIVNIVSNDITLNNAITSDADEQANVYVYTDLTVRPLRILDARFITTSTNEIPMLGISRQTYFDLPNKSSSGNATQFYYNPLLTNGKLYIWPTASSVSTYISATTTIPLQDFDTLVNTADIPQEWLLPLIYNAAVLLAPGYGVSLSSDIGADIKKLAEQYKEDALGFDQEIGSINISPSDEDVRGWE